MHGQRYAWAVAQQSICREVQLALLPALLILYTGDDTEKNWLLYRDWDAGDTYTLIRRITCYIDSLTCNNSPIYTPCGDVAMSAPYTLALTNNIHKSSYQTVRKPTVLFSTHYAVKIY